MAKTTLHSKQQQLEGMTIKAKSWNNDMNMLKDNMTAIITTVSAYLAFSIQPQIQFTPKP